MESLRGKLLVSSPRLVDPNFRKTVVLIAHHDGDGAMGLVLSRPSDVPSTDAVPPIAGLPGADGPVFVGGPVQPESFVLVARFEDGGENAVPIFERVGFLRADAEITDAAVERVRLFAGYAGWGAGQLEDELSETSWIVVDAAPDDPFADDPDALWRDAVGRAGTAAALMRDMPYDPRLN